MENRETLARPRLDRYVVIDCRWMFNASPNVIFADETFAATACFSQCSRRNSAKRAFATER